MASADPPIKHSIVVRPIERVIVIVVPACALYPLPLAREASKRDRPSQKGHAGVRLAGMTIDGLMMKVITDGATSHP